MGTIYDPFSAHRYLDFQGELSHVTLAGGAQGKLIDAQGAADAHPRLIQTIANAFGIGATVGLRGNGTIGGVF